MESRQKIDVGAYLSRIGFGETRPTVDAAGLRSLQRAHLLAVPFENLDIHWTQPIVLDTAMFYAKIVAEKRGGFCYELNGLFNELLRALGFETRLVSARVFNGTDPGPEFDHAAIIVSIGNDEYLTDVGFGAFTAEPLRLIFDEEQQDSTGSFVIRKRDDDYFEVMKREDVGRRSEYMFKDISRELSEFSEMCDFQQYSPESHFKKGKLCSIMTGTGRKTLTDKSFVVTTNGTKTESPIGSANDFYETLEREFGIRKKHDR
jgi:N-hydroxyarylamine O-acetyltransferase